MTRNCPICEQSFSPHPKEYGSPRVYCSKRCKEQARSARYKKEHGRSRDGEKERTQRLGMYGLTRQTFQEKWNAQQGQCTICKRDLELRTGGYAIDHNHTSGRTRDILCMPCNTALGKFNDDPNLLRRAALYLDFHNNLTLPTFGIE